MTGRGNGRRRYDSTLRLEQAAGTRERIVAAGSDLLHRSSVRDWQALTVRAVAARAGVSERTIYRHFTNERGLRDAVMHRLEQEAGIELATMELEDIAEVTTRLFEHISSFPLEPPKQLDPTLNDANLRQHRALLSAVASRTPRWSDEERTVAAAMFDVLWSVATYQRLAVDWELDPKQAVTGIRWLVSLLAGAVMNGKRPD